LPVSSPSSCALLPTSIALDQLAPCFAKQNIQIQSYVCLSELPISFTAVSVRVTLLSLKSWLAHVHCRVPERQPTVGNELVAITCGKGIRFGCRTRSRCCRVT
jgi:hypothetical protein